MLQRTLPAGFIAPCLPIKTTKLPSGRQWLHEIKHDRSCIIDGKAVACDDNGVASFNLVRYRHHDESIFLYAFDLIELNGDDLRPDPLEGRKGTLEMIL